MNDLKDMLVMGDDGGGAEEAPEVDAMRDFLKAMKARDPKGMSMALERHYEACEGKDDEEEEPDSQGETPGGEKY